MGEVIGMTPDEQSEHPLTKAQRDARQRAAQIAELGATKGEEGLPKGTRIFKKTVAAKPTTRPGQSLGLPELSSEV